MAKYLDQIGLSTYTGELKKYFADNANQKSTTPTRARHCKIHSYHSRVVPVTPGHQACATKEL